MPASSDRQRHAAGCGGGSKIRVERGQRQPEAQGHLEVAGIVDREGMGGCEGVRLRPDPVAGSSVGPDRQGLQVAQGLNPCGGRKASPALDLKQHVGDFVGPKRRHRCTERDHRIEEGVGAVLVRENPGQGGRTIENAGGHRRPAPRSSFSSVAVTRSPSAARPARKARNEAAARAASGSGDRAGTRRAIVRAPREMTTSSPRSTSSSKTSSRSRASTALIGSMALNVAKRHGLRQEDLR